MEQVRCIECGALSNEIGIGDSDDELLYHCANGHIFYGLIIALPVPLDAAMMNDAMHDSTFYDEYKDVITALLYDGKDHH